MEKNKATSGMLITSLCESEMSVTFHSPKDEDREKRTTMERGFGAKVSWWRYRRRDPGRVNRLRADSQRRRPQGVEAVEWGPSVAW